MSNYRRVFIENSVIFVTMVTFKRNPILIKKIEELRHSFKVAKEKYKFEIVGIVILPDHLHMIIKPENIKEYPQIICTIKYQFSRQISDEEIEDTRKYLTLSKVKKKEKRKRCLAKKILGKHIKR